MISKIQVVGGHLINYNSGNYATAVFPINGNEQVGEVRAYGGELYAFNGNNWNIISTTTMIGLSPDLESVVLWAKNRMRREDEEASLLEAHPGLKRAKDHYELLKKLYVEESKT
jgi:hypothetical protein